jgi:predicted nucleic acid-binding protein
MIVVADTSPINYLILIDKIAIIETLYTRILIPHAVHDELLSPKAPAPVREWAKNPPAWLELLSPSTHLQPAIPRLDRGETEAIALAEELRADWLLIDEAAGRDEATKRGLQTIGTLGILREAHRTGLLDLTVEIDHLVMTGFRVNRALIQRLLGSLQ